MFDKILVPLDGSPTAETVLPYAVEIGRRFGAEIIFLQVVSGVPGRPPGAFLPTVELEAPARGEEDPEVKGAESYLRRKATSWGVGGVRIRWEIRRGAPAEEIIRSVGEYGVRLIAMTTHGRTGLARMVFGSVADQILRLAGVPVLLVRPKL